jgi:hypothetical protein
VRELLPIIAVSISLFVGYRLGKNTADEWYAKHPSLVSTVNSAPYSEITGGGSGTAMPLTVTKSPTVVRVEKACVLIYSDDSQQYEPCSVTKNLAVIR